MRVLALPLLLLDFLRERTSLFEQVGDVEDECVQLRKQLKSRVRNRIVKIKAREAEMERKQQETWAQYEIEEFLRHKLVLPGGSAAG